MIDYVQSFFLIVFAVFALGAGNLSRTPQVCMQNACVSVEVVSEKADMRRGLQGRTHLEPDHGMLFKFKEAGNHKFWMKDMQFSIDMLWIDEHNRLIHMQEQVPACTSESCPQFVSDQPSLYVLEVEAGFVHSHGLKMGDAVTFKHI